jgi:hypothetical protein
VVLARELRDVLEDELAERRVDVEELGARKVLVHEAAEVLLVKDDA